MTGRFLVLSVLAVGMATSASAQVTYRHHGDGILGDPGFARSYGSDQDMSYATHPSFQIFDTPYGTGVRVIERCAYPNGWNVTDFSRDMNGIPPDIDHTCPETYATGRRVRSRY